MMRMITLGRTRQSHNSPSKVPLSGKWTGILSIIHRRVMDIEWKRLNQETQALIEKNHGAGGNEYGFWWGDTRYSLHPPHMLKDQQLREIEPSLIQEARFLAEQAEQTARDERTLIQVLSVILSKCSTLQDVRDAIPEVFAREYDFNGLNRTRPENFLIENHPFLEKQYRKMQEVAEYYAANKFVFSQGR